MITKDNIDLYATYIHVYNMMLNSKNIMNSEYIEKNIIERIKKFPKVLRLQNEEKQNIGMLATIYGMFDVVNIALSDKVASTQTDINGKNIGIYLSETIYYEKQNVRDWFRQDDFIDDLLIKALKNPIASIQQDNNGNNIGMNVARRKSVKVVKTALKNPIASKQKNKRGETILDIAYKTNLLEEKTRNGR